MINPDIDIFEEAPIAQLIAEWQSCGYNTQALRRLLTARLDAARWHARYGVREWRAIQRVNVLYLEDVLYEMDEERTAA